MKKTIAIIAGVIPAVSAVIAIFLMVSHFDSAVIRTVINITTLLQSLHLGCDFGIVERDSYLTGRLS